ncbi:MAG: ATP-binding cassette domain-containing protein [Acidimicrobiia bacterium]|nr:ATP-binding cassette domain-containing protein [Acidimicrobiia bacterium]
MIEFDDVWFRRGAHEVLRGISFSVARGETLALVGRSGAGKSTILKLINRMLEPHGGRVRVAGRDTREWDSTALRRQTGYVLQEVGLFPHMTVARNVGVVPSLVAWPAERIAQRAHELLDLVGLPAREFGERWPDQLSGGQRQRVGVARARRRSPGRADGRTVRLARPRDARRAARRVPSHPGAGEEDRRARHARHARSVRARGPHRRPRRGRARGL